MAFIEHFTSSANWRTTMASSQKTFNFMNPALVQL